MENDLVWVNRSPLVRDWGFSWYHEVGHHVWLEGHAQSLWWPPRGRRKACSVRGHTFQWLSQKSNSREALSLMEYFLTELRRHLGLSSVHHNWELLRRITWYGRLHLVNRTRTKDLVSCLCNILFNRTRVKEEQNMLRANRFPVGRGWPLEYPPFSSTYVTVWQQ